MVYAIKNCDMEHYLTVAALAVVFQNAGSSSSERPPTPAFITASTTASNLTDSENKTSGGMFPFPFLPTFGDKAAPSHPSEVDVTGLADTACVFKLVMFFPNISNGDIGCYCFGILCANQTEEELRERLVEIKQLSDKRHGSGDDIYLGVSYVTVMAVGAVGNILVLVTVLKVFKSPSVTNLFISSLALADLVVVLLCIPFRLTDYVGSQIWILGAEACKVTQYIFFYSFMCSVFTLTAMSLERYLVICYPMKAVSMSTPGRAKKIIAVVWTIAAVLSIPSALMAGERSLECDMYTFENIHWRIYYFLYLFAIIFLIPSILMAFAYGRTAFALYQSIAAAGKLIGEKKKESEKATSDTKARIQVIRMLTVVWILFTVTWGSFLSFHLFESYLIEMLNIPYIGSQLTIAHQTLSIATMANSAVNPILYAFLSSQFRKGFIKCFSCIPIVRRKYLTSTSISTGSSGMRSTAISAVSATVKS